MSPVPVADKRNAKSSRCMLGSLPLSIFQERFILTEQLGKGGFGEVFRAVHTETNEVIAVKVERNDGSPSFLFHEARVMQEIQRCRTSDGHAAIATLKYFGQEGDFRMLIMALHGSSLEDLLERAPGRRFSLKTTIMLGVQMLKHIEFVHQSGYLHRDLKPDNFVTGRTPETSKRIYLVDFGLSCRYITPDQKHREMQSKKAFVGTSRYASLRTHQGFSQSRRDDLEQLVYVLIYLYRGCLPWTGLQIRNRREKEQKMAELKARLSPADICAKCPQQFSDILYYARNMSYNETPQYEMCRVRLMSALDDQFTPAEQLENDFDWLAREPHAVQVPAPMPPPQFPQPAAANAPNFCPLPIQANDDNTRQPPLNYPPPVGQTFRYVPPQPVPIGYRMENTQLVNNASGQVVQHVACGDFPPINSSGDGPLPPKPVISPVVSSPQLGSPITSTAGGQGILSGSGILSNIQSIGDKD